MDDSLALTREQSRRVDLIAIERYGMSGLVLMENAGRGAAEALLAFDPSPGAVAILCGKGNNAGDGFVIARHLHIRGVAVSVLLLNSPAELAGDARTNFKILAHCDVPLVDLSANVSAAALAEHAQGATWLVDAMLGTGAAGEPREPYATAVWWMNVQAARRMAVDVPSGLDCDTGAAAAATVRADLTCTFVAMKRGFLVDRAKPFLGKVRVASIGVPPRLVREAAGT